MKEIFKRFRELIEFYKNDSYHKNYFVDLYTETVWYYGDAEDILDYEFFIESERQQLYEIVKIYKETAHEILSKMVKELRTLKEVE